MPIEFSFRQDDQYSVATWSGKITDEEMMRAYMDYYESDHWHSGLSEFADLGDADFSAVTTEGIRRFASAVLSKLGEIGAAPTIGAVYAPKPLPFGMARMYGLLTEESPENTRIFKERQDAENWLHQEIAELRS